MSGCEIGVFGKEKKENGGSPVIHVILQWKSTKYRRWL